MTNPQLPLIEPIKKHSIICSLNHTFAQSCTHRRCISIWKKFTNTENLQAQNESARNESKRIEFIWRGNLKSCHGRKNKWAAKLGRVAVASKTSGSDRHSWWWIPTASANTVCYFCPASGLLAFLSPASLEIRANDGFFTRFLSCAHTPQHTRRHARRLKEVERTEIAIIIG